MSRIWPSMIGALALAAPLAPPSPHALMVRVCGGAGQVLFINLASPDGGSAPEEDHGCCKGSACHAGCERRTPRKGTRP